MPFPPQQPTDPFNLINPLKSAGRLSGLESGNTNIPGFEATNLPSPSSNGRTRSSLPSNRPAISTRNLIQWFVPETGVVEMYVNPQQITYQFKKHITNQRTKGGYLLQYWGEELTQLSINGTTGSSGVEGVNVLYDIYRNEQVQFDPYALALASDRDTENNDQFSFLGDFSDGSFGDLLTGVGEGFTDLVANSIETGATASTRSQPTLASLAFSVEMYYSGWVFRGYFTDFRIDERADKLGLFDYSTTFVVTQRRGLRPNFLGWHRNPDGPSNSDPLFGRPYSYAGLYPEQAPPTQRRTQENGASLIDLLQAVNPLTTLDSVFKSIF